MIVNAHDRSSRRTVDYYTIRTVVHTLVDICYEKAEHVRTNYHRQGACQSLGNDALRHWTKHVLHWQTFHSIAAFGEQR